MDQINLYNDKKNQLLKSIQDVSGIMKEINMSKEYDMCTELYKKLRNDTFKVVVMGRFKVGKSTFINALLGSGDVLPAQATPCTAVINEVKYSKDRHAQIYFKHPIPSPLPKLAPNIKKYIESFKGKQVPPIKVDAKYLNQFVVIDDEAENQKEGIAQTPFAKAEIYWDLPICQQGIEIIDTPGLDENMSRTDLTKNYLSQADAIIFVLDCTAPCAMTEMQSIENDVMKAGHEFTIFVCNKINLVKEKERESIKRHMNSKLSSKTKLGQKGIYYLNAEEAKDGRAENDESKFTHSGMAAFESQLDEVLAKKRGTIKLLQPARQIKTAIEYAITTAIPNERKMLEMSTQEINERLQRELPNLERLKQEKELITSQIENEISKICRDTELLLHKRYNEIIQELPKWINGISCTNSVSWNPLKVKESVRLYSEELIERFQDKLAAEQESWQKNVLEPFVSSRFQEMAKKFEATITRIFVDIERIKLRISGIDDTEVINDKDRIGALVAGFFGGGITGAVVGGTLGFSKEFIATLAAQIALGVILGSIIGPTNPITLVAVIVAGFVGMGAGLTKIEEKIRHKITNQVTEQIRSDRDDSVKKAIDLIRGKLQDGSSNLSNAIDSELQSVEDLVSQIKRDKQQGEQHVNNCILTLEKNKTLFKEQLITINSIIKNMEEVDIDFIPLQNDSPEQKEGSDSSNDLDSTHTSEEQPDHPVNDPEPVDDSEYLSCPNPKCQNFGKKNLPPATKYCPECGSPIKNEEAPYLIEPGKESFEKNGISFIRIFSSCPTCQSGSQTYWKHWDKNCGGDMYIGDNSHIICGKCSKEESVEYWKLICNESISSDSNYLSCVEQKQDLDSAIKIAGEMAKKMGTKWFRKFMDNLPLN